MDSTSSLSCSSLSLLFLIFLCPSLLYAGPVASIKCAQLARRAASQLSFVAFFFTSLGQSFSLCTGSQTPPFPHHPTNTHTHTSSPPEGTHVQEPTASPQHRMRLVVRSSLKSLRPGESNSLICIHCLK